jgi:hypothetical protein
MAKQQERELHSFFLYSPLRKEEVAWKGEVS